MKVFGREPALILGVVQAALSLVVGFNLDFLSQTQATLIVAAISAVFGLMAAWATTPWAPGAFTAVIGAGAALLAGYGLDFSQESVAALGALVTALMLFLGTRPQVSPTSAGPVP